MKSPSDSSASFRRRRFAIEELQQFIGMLHKSNLVITDAAGQGTQLKKRRDEKVVQQRWATLANILSVRFKGIDPERLLNFLHPLVRWFFSVPAMILLLPVRAVGVDAGAGAVRDVSLTAAVVSYVLCGKELDLSGRHAGGHEGDSRVWPRAIVQAFWRRVPRDGRDAAGDDALSVLQRLGLVDAAESLASGGDRGGRDVRRAGAWRRLPRYVWWFTEPGPANYVALNVMFVCSVSTVMFNANPLLRYDGYYILSDVLEIPNLRQKASTILNRKLGSWCLGLEEPDDPFLPKRKQLLFAMFTVASAIYRWVVVLSILYFLNQVFEPYGLKAIGQLIAMGALLRAGDPAAGEARTSFSVCRGGWAK